MRHHALIILILCQSEVGLSGRQMKKVLCEQPRVVSPCRPRPPRLEEIASPPKKKAGTDMSTLSVFVAHCSLSLRVLTFGCCASQFLCPRPLTVLFVHFLPPALTFHSVTRHVGAEATLDRYGTACTGGLSQEELRTKLSLRVKPRTALSRAYCLPTSFEIRAKQKGVACTVRSLHMRYACDCFTPSHCFVLTGLKAEIPVTLPPSQLTCSKGAVH